MTFLYEKQARRFFIFLLSLCFLLICGMGTCGVLQARRFQQAFVKRELTAVSYLLEKEVPPGLVASAWNNRTETREGSQFLKQIGHTPQSQGYSFLLFREISLPRILILSAMGALFTAVLTAGTILFLRKRELMYEEADRILRQYGDNQFENHLPAGENGMIYQLFGNIEQLALSLQAKGETEHQTKQFLKNMISNISHQLKTPLTALNMYLEIMSEEIGNEETLRKFTQKSMQSLERMEQLIQSLLTMARLDTGSILFEKRQCLIAELAEQSVEHLLERAKQEHKEIVLTGPPDEHLFCDQEWTAEALGNIVKNALDHTDSGGKIQITWIRTPAVIRLSVEDTGCGIAPEDIHRIFRQFYRSPNSRDTQGAGLGLSLAKSIVEGQGGSLSVESHPGDGTTFRISFLTNL